MSGKKTSALQRTSVAGSHFILPELPDPHAPSSQEPGPLRSSDPSLLAKVFSKSPSSLSGSPLTSTEDFFNAEISAASAQSSSSSLSSSSLPVPILSRQAYVEEQDKKMDLHRRLDAELKERHAFLAEKQKSLEDKDSSLSARSQVLEAQSKMLDDKLKQADALKRLQDELENRQITVKYQESKILDLTKELAAKERLLAQKEEALALKETQLADLIARSATMQTSAQSNASLLNAEDDAILFLAEELEKTKRSFKHRAAVKQLGVAPAEDASEDVRHAIHECKVLLSIDKVESAKQKYTEIKKRFEALPAPDRVLYQEIVALYQQIRVAMSHDAL